MEDVLDLTHDDDTACEEAAMAAGHRAYHYALDRIKSHDDFRATQIAERFGQEVASELWGEEVTDAIIASMWRHHLAYIRKYPNR
jgi:hypothetical protein